MPSANQIEDAPHFPQPEQRAAHGTRGVATRSWSPLGRGSELLTEPVVLEAAHGHGVTPAQEVLRRRLRLDAQPGRDRDHAY
ncbi:hypothetical protein [Streptomyces sp. NPDC048385]|uniref:hypothetical protein n=1 Tax=unclassified Streptomyces TaxID=2593676 RepID=UPI003419A92C